MTVEIIAAVSLNRAIGKQNGIPWSSPGDLRRFRARTLHKTVVMGRRTWESLGKPLPLRKNVVVSRTMPDTPGVKVIRDVEEIFNMTGHICVIGGSDIYAATIGRADLLSLSVIHTFVWQADAYFPYIPSGYTLLDYHTHNETPYVTDYSLGRI